MVNHLSRLWLILACWAVIANAQEENVCYRAGSMAAAVILSILFTALLLAALYYLWKKYRKRKEHLILETDPEKGKGEYAFDNPGFKDPSITPVTKTTEKNNKLESIKPNRWNQWSPLSALTTKSEKRKTLDDSAIDGNEVKVVALRSHDFTGLGFNICGNMKEGIYIKDVLHRGPASESGKLNPGDRINSVTISFEHMVYEDALTILSYASPYEVIIEARGGKIVHHSNGQGAQPSHPVYRSSSCTDLFQIENSAKKRLFSGEDYSGSVSSNYSSLQKSRSNMTTLERKESKSPTGHPNNRLRKGPMTKTHLTPEQLKVQLEQKINSDHHYNLKNKPIVEAETQKTESNRFQKFGVRVLPQTEQKSPKSAELSQNDNNINIEKQPKGIDEVDETRPQAKKREKKSEPKETFVRDNSINGSGIKRDANGIPQEIPSYMLNAAVAARSNRKNSEDRSKDAEDSDKTPKKPKGKAPAPPESNGKVSPLKNNYDEIQSFSDEVEEIINKMHSKDNKDDSEGEEEQVELRVKQNVKDEYNSDSDMEADNQSSVNTIELNSSDITIHHAEENEERQNRKTASTGDLTKIQKTRKSSTGTLERAQSLDITDASIPALTKKRKGGRIEDSDEDLFGKAMLNKEPRLSLILDGLNTFQRNKLKKSSEWGNLEDAILNLSQEDENSSFDQNASLENFDFGEKSKEFDALVNRINEIKRESFEIDAPIVNEEIAPIKPEKKIKNIIWPAFDNSENMMNGNAGAVPREEPEKVEVKEEVKPRIPAERRQRKPAVFVDKPVEHEVVVEEKKVLTKPAIPEKKEFLVTAPKRHVPPPPEAAPAPVDDAKWEDEAAAVSNKSDESKTSVVNPEVVYLNLLDLTKNFIFTERINCSQDDDDYRYLIKASDTNISDDIKVSRHSLGSLERPKSDDAKSVDCLRMNISNVTINNVPSSDAEANLHSLEVNVNEPSKDVSELYTTALDNTVKVTDSVKNDMSKVTISTPDIIKNVTLTEAINDLNNDVVIQGPSSLTVEIPREQVGVTESKFSTVTTGSNTKHANLEGDDSNLDDSKKINDLKSTSDIDSDSSPSKSLTYITEIQVMTPNNSNNTSSNISEIEIIPNVNSNRNVEDDFEKYVKSIESSDGSPKSLVLTPEDAEKELHKIKEIAEEQLKKLPEMRFTTSSYESPKTPTENKRQSQIELLRSNFERSPPKSTRAEVKSRIPIATTAKTPPTSPERRDSRNLDMDNAKEIMELMSSTVHSTPVVSSHSIPKYQIKSPSKNVTVTSIRSNSKIPSGLPVLGGASRPPIPPRKQDSQEEHVVQVSTNGNVESSFKQWVFNPSDNTVTNIVLSESKQK